jgi:hypothetical protein
MYFGYMGRLHKEELHLPDNRAEWLPEREVA